MEQEQEHVFVNAFLFLFPKCSLSVHEHGKERRTLEKTSPNDTTAGEDADCEDTPS